MYTYINVAEDQRLHVCGQGEITISGSFVMDDLTTASILW